MNNEITCAVVKDLLPNYIDKLTSEETNHIIEEHLSDCHECTKELDEMMGNLKIDQVPKQSNLEVFLNKTKRMYLLKGIAFSIGIIGIFVSFIVDMAVNRSLTWSLIVDASMIYIYATALTAIFSKRNRLLKATLVSSTLTLPLLYIIEYIINENYLMYPIYWFKKYALPISLIWLAILWINILFRKLAKLNIWSTMGVLLLLTIFGSALTNAIANQVSMYKAFRTDLEWIDSLSYLGAAIICFIIGYIRRDKSKF